MPAVAPGIGEGAEKAISGLITSVGSDVSVTALPMPLLPVASTTIYFPSSESVGVNEADVAPEIFVQVPRFTGSVHTFH